VLLAAAAAAVALVGTVAALLADSGQELTHQSLREDVKRTAAIVEDVRAVYQDELYVALLVAQARIHGDALRAAALRQPRELRTLLRAQGLTEAVATTRLARSAGLTAKPAYTAGFGEYNVLRRLADLRAKNPALVALDPDETQARWAHRQKTASLLVGTTVLLAVAFLLGALAHAFPRGRRLLVATGYVAVGAGICAALALEVVR
jgi:hypothetical protein